MNSSEEDGFAEILLQQERFWSEKMKNPDLSQIRSFLDGVRHGLMLARLEYITWK